MRKATIDLDWLDSEISWIEKLLLGVFISNDVKSHLEVQLFEAKLIRGNCTPIEELPKSCINNREDKKFCTNNGKCKMCNQ